MCRGFFPVEFDCPRPTIFFFFMITINLHKISIFKRLGCCLYLDCDVFNLIPSPVALTFDLDPVVEKLTVFFGFYFNLRHFDLS